MATTHHKTYATGLMWFRRDLRVDDNAALHHALRSCQRVFCVFVFDPQILGKLPRADRRVEFIRESLLDLEAQLHALTAAAAPGEAALLVELGAPQDVIEQLARQLSADAVFANHDYEPRAIARDEAVQRELKAHGVGFHTFKDQVIFERAELLTLAGRPYTVFTPYKNAWLKKVDAFYVKGYPVAEHAKALAIAPREGQGMPTLSALGFESTNLRSLKLPPGSQGGQTLLADFLRRIDGYDSTRDFPALKGPSYLGVHLRFGTVSVRHVARLALERQQQGSPGASVWLSELIWRDFYAQILSNFPHVELRAFKPEYDAIVWRSDAQAQQDFAAWCRGETGFPLVDAAIAQLLQTGYMHNRLRMVTASFLIKDLGIDWRWGEAFFAEKLNDFDLASNNGGWQWAASSGCDAQPYFRIFNPVSQSQKFDADGVFIRTYLPVLARLDTHMLHAPWLASPQALLRAGVTLGQNYPLPLVQHDMARAQTLLRYASVKAAASHFIAT